MPWPAYRLSPLLPYAIGVCALCHARRTFPHEQLNRGQPNDDSPFRLRFVAKIRYNLAVPRSSQEAACDFRFIFAYNARIMEVRGLPTAWVVKCKKCSCVVTCRALDPQREHEEPHNQEPAPQQALIVTCSCCWSPFRYEPSAIFRGSPAPGSSCDRNRRNSKSEEKKGNALFFAASLIAAVRLNREEIKSSPVVHSKIADSIQLAEMIYRRLQRQ